MQNGRFNFEKLKDFFKKIKWKNIISVFLIAVIVVSSAGLLSSMFDSGSGGSSSGSSTSVQPKPEQVGAVELTIVQKDLSSVGTINLNSGNYGCRSVMVGGKTLPLSTSVTAKGSLVQTFTVMPGTLIYFELLSVNGGGICGIYDGNSATDTSAGTTILQGQNIYGEFRMPSNDVKIVLMYDTNEISGQSWWDASVSGENIIFHSNGVYDVNDQNTWFFKFAISDGAALGNVDCKSFYFLSSAGSINYGFSMDFKNISNSLVMLNINEWYRLRFEYCLSEQILNVYIDGQFITSTSLDLTDVNDVTFEIEHRGKVEDGTILLDNVSYYLK